MQRLKSAHAAWATLMSRRAAAKRALIECACLRRIDGLAVGEEAGWVLNRAAPATSGRQRNGSG